MDDVDILSAEKWNRLKFRAVGTSLKTVYKKTSTVVQSLFLQLMAVELGSDHLNYV